MKLRILVDIDGIVADTIPYWLEYVGKKTGVWARVSDITQYDLTKCPPLNALNSQEIFSVLQEPGFTTGIPLMHGADTALAALMGLGHEVYLVTARSGDVHIAETFAWVNKHLPFIDTRKQLIFLYDKHLLKADVIIDDRQDTLDAYASAHPDALCTGILYPYNGATTLIGSSGLIKHRFVLVPYEKSAWLNIYHMIMTLAANS